MTTNSVLAPSQTQLFVQLGFSSPTPVQEQAVPILAQGLSLKALAPTGSGKTLAFLVPLMSQLCTEEQATQLLILAPTRELGLQIAQVARDLVPHLTAGQRPISVCTAFGGQKADTQKVELSKRPAVVVATPGRALELLEREVLLLDKLKAFVLDEGDLMLGMGFEKQVARICDFLPRRAQVAFFSATEAEMQTSLYNRLVHRAVKIDVRESPLASENRETPERGVASSSVPHALSASGMLHQTLTLFPDQDKTKRLIRLVREIDAQTKTGLVFCQTRESVHSVALALQKAGISAEALSGQLGQVERTTLLRRFKAGGFKYLVATNLASRGLDVKELSVVLNFDLPSTAEEYVHRSGRSGRAGLPGWTLSLCTERSRDFLKGMLQEVGIETLPFEAVPGRLPEEKSENPTEEKPALEARTFKKLHINRGKSSKLRPGDFLGALTQNMGLHREEVGSIFIFDHFTHVEIDELHAARVLSEMSRTKIKNLAVRATPAGTLTPVRERP